MNDTAEKQKPTLGRRLAVAGVLLILLAAVSGGGAGAYYFFVADEAGAAGATAAKPVKISDPIYLKVGPMTVNIQSNRGDRLLYMSMSVKVGDDATKSFLETNMPDVNNRMLILLSQQRAEDLNAIEGKQLVAERILDALREPFSDPQPELAIEGVFFQEFIVQ